MDAEITANGTLTVTPAPGRYVLSFEGTPDAGAVVVVKVSTVTLTTPAGTTFQVTGGALPEPMEIAVGGPVAIVTTGYGSSSGLRYFFRRIPSS